MGNPPIPFLHSTHQCCAMMKRDLSTMKERDLKCKKKNNQILFSMANSEIGQCSD